MFYSHQLLARKAPLGQIWMAATMHSKINRRNLYKIDIVKICEEILNPSIPLALRLSGILMGGVVIVYERKVKLLYEDVTRLLVQINEAWRVTTVGDPTLLPKGKSQAKFEAITLKDGDEMEQALHFSSTTFDQQSYYYPMRLDHVEEFITRDDDQPQLHQVDPSHITLQDDLESHQPETNIYDRFDRFDIEDGVENNLNLTPQDLFQTVDMPQTPKRTPPPQEPLQSNEIQHEHREEPRDESTIKSQQERVNLEEQRKLNKRKRSRATGLLFDNEQIIIEGNQYQSWLQNTSDIVSRRRGEKLHMPVPATKSNKLMELPTLGLISGMDNDLLELWKKFSTKQSDVAQPGHGSSSHLHENNHPPEPSFEFAAAAENFQGNLGAQQLQSPVEKGLPHVDILGASDSLKRKLFGMTAGSSGGLSANSISSSASGPISLELEHKLASGSKSKRTRSSAKHSSGGLDRVEEEIILEENGGSFKLPQVSENGSTGELELLVETAPTQTPKPMAPLTIDKTTHSILNHLKEHFNMPSAPQTESLNQLAFGMNPSQAARLFYQTCVLASHDFVSVEQVESYGDIYISRGAKM